MQRVAPRLPRKGVRELILQVHVGGGWTRHRRKMLLQCLRSARALCEKIVRCSLCCEKWREGSLNGGAPSPTS